MWTTFMDMHSGGGCKEDPYEYIYIEAPMKEAISIFYNRFKHNPYRVTCTCCGEDYDVDESKTLEEATKYNRRYSYTDNRSAETLEEYKKHKYALFIEAKDIKEEEKKGEAPAQGYVWVGD